MSMSNYLESGILNHVFRTDPYVKPATIAIALTTNHPNASQNGGTIEEVANVGDYSRVDLGPPSDDDWSFVTQENNSGILDNLSQISFPAATSDWGMVSGVCILDSGVYGAGNVLLYSALPVPRDIRTNDTFNFGVGGLDILLN